jgi:hypothetical protein
MYYYVVIETFRISPCICIHLRAHLGANVREACSGHHVRG